MVSITLLRFGSGSAGRSGLPGTMSPGFHLGIPERTINHHCTYHVAQASHAKHGSLVDRGANAGIAGSDLRILSRSSRKCTVTGIDSHELQGLDVVQCAALVETNHGIVKLIMNEYACYGKGHIPSIPLDRLSGLKTQLMIGLSKLVENR